MRGWREVGCFCVLCASPKEHRVHGGVGFVAHALTRLSAAAKRDSYAASGPASDASKFLANYLHPHSILPASRGDKSACSQGSHEGSR